MRFLLKNGDNNKKIIDKQSAYQIIKTNHQQTSKHS